MVLPPLRGKLRDAGLKRWLSRATLYDAGAPNDLFGEILALLGKPIPVDGRAAMRMWGQTGDRPTVWIAAADPVYLEPRLDHLCLHALYENELSKADLRPLFDHLQTTLGDDSGFGFARLGDGGYLRSDDAIASASVPMSAVDGRVPNDYMPEGGGASRFRNLLSEIEMALHDHPVNVERQLQGKWPVNSLWIWGGGFAPEQQIEPMPMLFADDASLRGYWESVTGVIDTWPGTITSCLESAVAGFVAVAPLHEADPDFLETCLRELRDAQQSGRLGRLELVFADGPRVSVGRLDRFRFWRRLAPLLEADTQ